MTLVRSIHQRLPVPLLRFLVGFNGGDVFLIQRDRIGNATEMDAHEAVLPNSGDLAAKIDRIADFNLSHQNYMALCRKEARHG